MKKIILFSLIFSTNCLFSSGHFNTRKTLKPGKYVVTFARPSLNCAREHHINKIINSRPGNILRIYYFFGKKVECIGECPKVCLKGTDKARAYIDIEDTSLLEIEGGHISKIVKF